MFAYLTLFVVVYLFASVPWGFLIGRAHGIDIRTRGSGNIGATNVRRVLGRKWGLLCFGLDFLKGYLPVLLVVELKAAGSLPEEYELAVVMAAFAAVAGHVWSAYLNFKGGKGIATCAGVLLGMAPFSLIGAAAVWAGLFFASRYVSLASIVAAVSLPVWAVVLGKLHVAPPHPPLELALLVVFALLAVWRHRDNIRRLARGTENRFERRPKA